MKMKKSLSHLMMLGFLLSPTIGKSQQTGLQLIHNLKPKKYAILKKQRQLKVKYFANGRQLEANGFYENNTASILTIRQKAKTIYFPSRIHPKASQTLHEIPIHDIQFISPLQKPIGTLISVMGICGITYSTVFILAAFNKSRPDLKKGFLTVGLVGLSISLPIIFLTKRKKYRLSKDGWEIK